MTRKPTRIMLLLPHAMAERSILYTQVIDYLKSSTDCHITIVSKSHPDQAQNSLSWEGLCRPFKTATSWIYLWSHLKFLMIYVIHMMAVYRFNSIHGFRGFEKRIRQQKFWTLPRWNEGHAFSHWLGFPFRKCTMIYNILDRILNASWARHRYVFEQFERIQPDRLFVVHLQNSSIIPYIAEAHARQIPIHGMIGSWDQPSTKGPICKGISKILVCNERLKHELIQWHQMKDQQLYVVGWPQMDGYYHKTPTTRQAFLSLLGLRADQNYILCGAYSERLGAHEPAIFETLAKSIERGELAPSTCIYIRAHPLDRDWEARLSHLKKFACVFIEPPSLNQIDHLSHLIEHAAVVLGSAGTILLDAIALDRPAIALAYAAEPLLKEDPHIIERYDMEHLHALMQTGAILKATSAEGLIHGIKESFEVPDKLQNERAYVRSQWLEPFDGLACKRIADIMTLG